MLVSDWVMFSRPENIKKIGFWIRIQKKYSDPTGSGSEALDCHVVGGDEHEDDGEVLVVQVRGHPVQQHRRPPIYPHIVLHEA